MIEDVREYPESAGCIRGCFAYLPLSWAVLAVEAKYGSIAEGAFSDIGYLAEQDTIQQAAAIKYRLPKEPILKELPEHQYMKDGPLKLSLPKILVNEHLVAYASRTGTVFAVDWSTQSSLL